MKKHLANSYNNFGVHYYDIGDVEKSMVYYFKSLEIYEEIDFLEG